MEFFTVGHGTRAAEELVEVLRSADVGVVVDVRRYPGSRRHPHFARESLEQALPAAGIAYSFRGDELGGRRSLAKDRPTRHPAWRKASFQAYADYMDTPAFRDALARLESEAGSGPPRAIMCAETLWWRCHRRLIADALALHGHEVTHLLDESSRQSHPLHPSVRADDRGHPVYDVGTTGQLT